jgi:hypothetical protein
MSRTLTNLRQVGSDVLAHSNEVRSTKASLYEIALAFKGKFA